MSLDQAMAALAADLRRALYARYAAHTLVRVDAVLAGYAGAGEAPRTAHQQVVNPRFYMPGLSARPWHDPSAFPEAALLRDRYPLIRRELEALLADPWPFGGPAGVVREGNAEGTGGALRGSWRSLYFQRNFRRVGEALWFPVTAMTLAGMQISREAMFSVLGPSTRVGDHTDGVNLFVSLYLPLVAPDGSWIQFAGEARAWREGECLAVDSSFVHASANPTASPRSILIVDLWHPELSAVERSALAWAVPQMDALLRAAAEGRA